MIKKICLFGLLLSLVGCGYVDRSVAGYTGNATKTCVDGVLYLQFTSGATVAYNKNGTVRICEK